MPDYIYYLQSYAMRHGIKILFTLFTLFTLTGCAGLLTRSDKTYAVGFYNLEKLYDSKANARNMDYTPTGTMKWDDKRYQQKLKNMAQAIVTIGGNDGPAVLGITEAESRKVLDDLVNTPPLKKKKYGIIHFESDDPLGLDVALLYNPKRFKPTLQKIIRVNYPQRNFKGKDILQVKGMMAGEPVTIYVNHWPPNYGKTRQGNRNRQAAAKKLRQQIDAELKTNPDANIIVMGDFDEEPRSKILQQTLKANGRPNPYYKEDLFNTFYINYVQGLGSFYKRGDFKMLDQIMVSKGLLDTKGLEYVQGSALIHDPEFLKYTFGKYKNTPRTTFSGTTYIGGYSDHFPVYIKVKVNK
ncbi:endonuclease/exonuclease/phosphatase family protein [Pontibacter sp. KCTC 32443]|uniref:endonuclease/exonuclease/phosphatase family protein n=1 Tax=Pontibacter TaxID=323449 RepID=UPI00164D02B6|nr:MULTISPECIES: endonuclease/exonuclease/phosphatase family protein [Pontibacter]MBC5773625.1 endonuclease/exonuclease/phosphatase family protein [Pontibacter sp. KCTC 32443]